MDADVIVVGSGPSGVMAAQSLVEAGLTVLMIDGGQTDTQYGPLMDPNKSFWALRQTDSDQHRYLLGDLFESVGLDAVGSGPQLTPPRQFIRRWVDQLMPVTSQSFSAFESLAKGGLGAGWGLGCTQFTPSELKEVGLDPVAMRPMYQLVADRIGISAGRDDISDSILGGCQGILPPIELDRNANRLLSRYRGGKKWFAHNDISLGISGLALLTQDKDGRQAFSYDDTEFYRDRGQSAYRSWMTVDLLAKTHLFNYRGNCLVRSFSESGDQVQVDYVDIPTSTQYSVSARKLVLAAGAIGTARIVLQSGGQPDAQVPILCNPFYYLPFIQWPHVGKVLEPHKTGFAQLMMMVAPQNAPVSMGSIYSYRSLMLFRLMKDAPLPVKLARSIFQFLQPGLSIVGIQHSDWQSSGKQIRLSENRLQIDYRLDSDQLAHVENRNALFWRGVRRLGGMPLRLVSPGHGASIHYAGTLPFSSDDQPFHVMPDGRLGGTKRVVVADGSGYKYLPGKSVTWTLMANAAWVAKRLVEAGDA